MTVSGVVTLFFLLTQVCTILLPILNFGSCILTKTGTCLFFVSEQGVGKDIIFNQMMKKIIGPRHFYSTMDINEVVGHFNRNLEGKTYAIVDEVDNISSEQHAALKSVITEDTVKIEKKGVDAYPVENYVNVVMTTNVTDRRIMRIDPSNRRFIIIECDSSVNRRDDKHEYFQDMIDFLGLNKHDHTGTYPGIKSFFYVLSSLNLREFDPRRIPVTDHTNDLKLQSLNSIHQWWLACLYDGDIKGYGDIKMALASDWEKGDMAANKEEFYRHYVSYCRYRGLTKISNALAFWKQMTKVVQYKLSQRGPNRVRHAVFPSLKVSKAQFERKMSFTVFNDGADGQGVMDSHLTVAPSPTPADDPSDYFVTRLPS
ncbi:MAG: DUF5906 domain-containing protein [Longimicrobiales bacterium]